MPGPQATMGYSANDMYYQNVAYCPGSSSDNAGNCLENQTAYTGLVKVNETSNGTSEQYEDAVSLYNREIIFTFNLIIGVLALMYYIYVNRDVLPTAESLTLAVSSIAEKAASAAKSGAKVPG